MPRGEHLGLLAAFGALRPTIAGIAAFSRCLWNLAFELPENREQRAARSRFVVVSRGRLLDLLKKNALFAEEHGATRVDALIERMTEKKFAFLFEERIELANRACQPLSLCRDLLSEGFLDYQLKYDLMLAIREHYGCAPSSQVAHLFNFLSGQLNELNQSKEASARPQAFRYEHLRQTLTGALNSARIDPSFASEAVDLFLECCRVLNYVQMDYKPGYVAVITRVVDAEYLLSRLFGLSTSMVGFDELFGGGLLLPDSFVDKLKPWSQGLILGRTVLVTGRYATGKSLLALQMAVEVAKKGGAAWFMPLEQTAEDCLYALETMCALPVDGSVKIARNTLELETCLSSPSNAGLLIFLRSVKESYDDFLELLPQHGTMLQRYPLRMVAIDPVNAISRAKKDATEYRERTISVLEQLKRGRTNVWMNVEESPGSNGEHMFEQNIADVVLRLSVSEDYGFMQTYMEVTKSRLQRQQRGRHPYVIQSGRGIAISPSSVSFADRTSGRRVRIGDKPQTFGITDFNRVIGPGLISSGDIIALVGPGGTFKTYVGLMFLFATGRPAPKPNAQEPSGQRSERIQNLLIPARDNTASLEARFDEKLLVARRGAFKQWGDVRICPMPSRHVQPGEILQRIEQEFLETKLRNQTVERVMVDNVPHWELVCPYVREDEIFADTLLKLFRGRGCTTLLTCSPIGAGSHLQKTIIDTADCVIEFSNIQFRGASRVLVRVIKTRRMLHRRETFELVFSEEGIELSPDSELLRVSVNNEITQINVRLFLHSENDIQREYNEDVRASVQSTLAPNVDLDLQTRVDVTRQAELAAVSSVDELQILQLDEFQVRGFANEEAGAALYQFHYADWDNVLWQDFEPRLLSGLKVKHGRFIAVPFCRNVSVLAYHTGRISGLGAQSWEELARQCRDPERKPSRNSSGEAIDGSVVFDFAQVSDENFNCLFFEILHARQRLPGSHHPGAVEEWLRGADAVEAAKLMRQLCRDSYRKRRNQALDQLRKNGPSAPKPLSIELDPTATVWRTWYSTLMQMLARLSPEEAAQIEVVTLPGEVSVAGEWFLGVPSYSAAPDVALRLVRHLTTRDAEFERLKRGVGLPTRSALYPTDGMVSESFRLPMTVLNRLFEQAFHRSDIPFYRELSSILSTHLKAIIEMPFEDIAEIKRLLETAVFRTIVVRKDRSSRRL